MAKRIKEKAAKVALTRENRAHASANYIRISPGKVMIVMDTIRGKNYDEAVGILSNMSQKAAGILLKVLQSAGANAENNMSLNKSDLMVAKIYCDQGPTLKRFYAAGKGSAHPILKRSSHINVVLDSMN